MPTTPAPTDEPEPIGGPATDRWWWSGGLRLVAGGGVVAYQVPVLSDGAVFLNWVMVVVGVGIAVWGAQRLWQDYATHRSALVARNARDGDVPGAGPTSPDEDVPTA